MDNPPEALSLPPRTRDRQQANPVESPISPSPFLSPLDPLALWPSGLLNTPGRSRTCNPRFRRPMLYPIELRVPCCETLSPLPSAINSCCPQSYHFPRNPRHFRMNPCSMRRHVDHCRPSQAVSGCPPAHSKFLQLFSNNLARLRYWFPWPSGPDRRASGGSRQLARRQCRRGRRGHRR